MPAKRSGAHSGPDREVAPRSACPGTAVGAVWRGCHRAARRGVPAVRREPPSGRLRPEALSAACRQQAGAVARRDVVVASSGAPPAAEAAWRWRQAVPWPVVPSGSAAQALRRVRRAAAWRRRHALRRAPGRGVGVVGRCGQGRRRSWRTAELEMRSVREELPSALACAQAAPRSEPSVSACVRGARPSAAAHAQAAQPREAAAVPDARAARRRRRRRWTWQEPQRAAEAEVSVGAAGLQPAAEVAAVWARPVALRPGVAAEGWDAAVPRREVALSDELARRPAARPSAAAWVFRRDRAPAAAALARRRAARSAHAMRTARAASPSERSWQAARDEGLS